MADLVIVIRDEDLAWRLLDRARKQNQTVEAMLLELLEAHHQQKAKDNPVLGSSSSPEDVTKTEND
jgi:hypothetical protein